MGHKIFIDPYDCRCTECLTDESVPAGGLTTVQLWQIFGGMAEPVNRTGCAFIHIMVTGNEITLLVTDTPMAIKTF